MKNRFPSIRETIFAQIADKKLFEQARQALGLFKQVSLVDPALAVLSARNYRTLRRSGVVVRKTIDCLIATYCIENEHSLLHSDSDYDGFERHLGLKVVYPSGG